MASASAGLAALACGQEPPESIRKLRPMLDGVQPVTDDERLARRDKALRLMRRQGLDAIVCEGGASLFYYTGVRWSQSDSALAWILPAAGEACWIVPEAAG